MQPAVRDVVLPRRHTVEALALFARFTTQPDAKRKALIDNCIRSLKAAGIWSKLECLYLIAAHDAQAAQRNWKGDSFNLSPANSPTFTTDRGYAGDGSTSYLDTGFAPSSGTLFLLNSASLGCWLNAGATNLAVVAAMGASVAGTGTSQILPFFTGNIVSGAVNAGTSANGPTVATRLGFSATSRLSATEVSVYRDATASAPQSNSSSSRNSGNVFLCGRNVAGALNVPVNNRFAAAFMGGGLTDAEMLALYITLGTYLTAIGAS